MKMPVLTFAEMVLMLITLTARVSAQPQEKTSKFSTGADLYSNYIWRGTKYGTGPAVQPSVKFAYEGLTVGVWGSFDSHGYAETDPYISYSFPFGLSLGFTDYYYPGLDVFDFSTYNGSHALELNAGFTTGGLALSANYIFNEAGGAASSGGDKYFQLGYSFTNFSLFAGAGDGWHTTDGNFNFCNIGIGTTKEISITDKFSIPVSGQVILNPDRQQLYVVVGFSL
jgi:uncharacterized protein (TIGR02001 family)